MKKYVVYFCINDFDYHVTVLALTIKKAKYQAFLEWKKYNEDAKFKIFIRHSKAFEKKW
jgi:hypothetical protein